MVPQATFDVLRRGVHNAAPDQYADLLKKKLQEHNTHVYLINTGWTGGVYNA
ncbi:hypothetical protein V7S43_017654 [Phytophthora oleae]|uniref:Phosphoenolpyruvate carboxykinase (ATP) n=1 Tax=Phytophthora oleae TaxID=2107226 RepID=A0ABD3ET35_9STRA